jgi:hypothetical protein
MADTTAGAAQNGEGSHITAPVPSSTSAPATAKQENVHRSDEGLKELETPNGDDLKESVPAAVSNTKSEADAGAAPAGKPAGGSKIGTFLKSNIPIFLMMGKAALPPAIIMAIYQTDAVAKILGSLGYLSSISKFTHGPTQRY